MHDFLIVGGGINGLLLARELAATGAQVVLVDRGRCGQEASWAGGGIISPLYPWRYAPAITALASWAQDFYPTLVAALALETGIDAQLQRSGLLMLDAADENEALAWAQRCGRAMQRLDAGAIMAREPRLAPGFHSALWMPSVANVRNPRLIRALVESLRQQANVQLLEQCQVTELLASGNRVSGVSISREGRTEPVLAAATVVSAGAWTGKVLQAVGIDLPVTPVKGQMLLYKLPAQTLHSIVLTAGRYLIPRRDGHILAGSTLEHCDFDKTATAEARQDLMASACALLPALAGQTPVAHWAGLRPGAPQGIPYIGLLPGFTNLYVNAGQFRNGLVLAPASARLLADCLLQRAPIVDPAPYEPETRLTVL